MSIDQKKLKRLDEIIRFEEEGETYLLDRFTEIEEKIDNGLKTANNKAEKAIEIAKETQKMEGEPGHTPTDQELEALIIPLIPEPLEPKPYILTEKDKEDIAGKIEVPLVEKIVEKKETIIKEQPIVREYSKETKIEDISGEKIVERINELSIDDPENLIGIEHIKGLLKRLEAIERQGEHTAFGIVSGRNIFTDIDLSPQLDGVKKTFNIPAVWNIISVDTSSFPHALRKGIDYTWTPTSITFTDEILASTTLASGQTVILTVVSG